MSLSVGSKLGSYEILSPLGAGGMGEVYRAKDTKLKRDVALKVLPEAFASDPERMARFQREAEVLAWLNHPNIAQIYGVEDRALVMELVEGDSPKGPMQFDEAWKIASQIAAGLEYAHEKGIVHRDLKPANIKITPEGVVKLLDFGLAKAFTGQTVASGNPENSPTLTLGATQLGVILGTAAYMSPEQAGGKPVDNRADIWSFGAVLYELLSGKRAFDGDSVSETLASVLKVEPDWNGLPKATPPGIRKLLRRCLTKDRKQRLQAIGEARITIDEKLAGVPEPPESPLHSPSSKAGLLGWITAAVAATAALLLAFLYLRAPLEQHGTVKLLLPLAAKSGLANTLPAVSPDGRRVAFVAITDGRAELSVRDLESLTARLLPGTLNATFPFWSPDGHFLGFFADGKLKKVDLAGGPPITLCEAQEGRGASWNQDGVILFAPTRANSGIFRVSAAGGTPVRVTELDGKAGEISHRFPWFLPDGHHFLFQNRNSDAEKTALFLGDLGSRERRRLLAVTSNAVYVPPGYLLFARDRTLMSVPFNALRGEVAGDPTAIAQEVDFVALDTRMQFAASQNGVLVYTSGSLGGNAVLTWYDRSGKALGAIAPPSDVLWPSISPDGKTVAVEHFDQTTDRDIWLHDVTRGAASRFSFIGTGRFPSWSPDGKEIAYRFLRNGTAFLVRKAVNGSPEEQVLYQGTREIRPTGWSPDGRLIVAELDADPKLKTRVDIWVVPSAGDKKPFPYLQSEFNERWARVSPDGRWLAYVSDETKRNEVYVQSFPNSGEKWAVSTNGGSYPAWSRDGKELYFISGDRKLMAVQVNGGARFQPGVSKPLFGAPLGSLYFGDEWFDVTSDGRFLIPTRVEGAHAAALTVVLNWMAGLKN